VREHVVETLAEPDAVLVLDETGFLKQGKSSCGVHRQYTGSAGKITNCQIGVFAAYVSTKGHAFLDRALYLPKAWTDDPNRRAATHVPETLAFATKPQLALAVIKRAIAADVGLGLPRIGGHRERFRVRCFSHADNPSPVPGGVPPPDGRVGPRRAGSNRPRP
jgi:SRSO17 transposase